MLLAADGLTNRQIADRLSVDPDTVSSSRSRSRSGRLPFCATTTVSRSSNPSPRSPPGPGSYWTGHQIAEVLKDRDDTGLIETLAVPLQEMPRNGSPA